MVTVSPWPAATLLLACAVAPAAAAAQKPLWEIGAGLTTLNFPDYRGSDQNRTYTLPLPYFVYRGEYLKADRHGVRGTFLHSDRIDFNISIGASLPVNSNDNRAREGMPNLDPTLEIGPSLDVTLWRTPRERYKLDLRLPLRSVFTVAGGVHDIGWVATPCINLDVADFAGYAGWNFGMLAGPMYGSRSYHEYFYSVQPQYATATRPAYDAPGGYAGSQFIMALTKRYPKYWLGAFVRWDTLQGAVFKQSPLVKRDFYFAAGIGIAWILGESSTRVDVGQ